MISRTLLRRLLAAMSADPHGLAILRLAARKAAEGELPAARHLIRAAARRIR